MLLHGMFSAEKLPETKAFVDALPNEAVAPKAVLEKIIKSREEEQRRIAMINAEAQLMQQRAQQFLMEDPDGQAQQMADAQTQLEAALMAQEAQYAEQEAELDEETAEAEEETDEE
jgi:hypothetical protein